MAGVLPDSTPGVSPARWLDQIRREAAPSDFVAAHQFLTDDQIRAASQGIRVTRHLSDNRLDTGQTGDIDDLGEPSEAASSDIGGGSVAGRSAVSDGDVAPSRADDDRSVVNADDNSSTDSDGDAGGDAMDLGGSKRTALTKAALAGKGQEDKLARVAKHLEAQRAAGASGDVEQAGEVREHEEEMAAAKGGLQSRKIPRVVPKVERGRGNPLFMQGGLHDPRLGHVRTSRGRQLWCATCPSASSPPVCRCGGLLEQGKRKHQFPRCVQCGKELRGAERVLDNPTPACLGHWGCVELPEQLWLVNPLVWDIVLTLLRAKCWWCHRFRVKPFALFRRVASLRLMNAGIWSPAYEEQIDARFQLVRSSVQSRLGFTGPDQAEGTSVPKKRKFGRVYNETQENRATVELIRWVDARVAEARGAGGGRSDAGQQAQLFDRRKQVVAQIWQELKGMKDKKECPHCRLVNPERVRARKQEAFYYDMSHARMAKNLAIAGGVNNKLTEVPGSRDHPEVGRKVTVTLPQFGPAFYFDGKIKEVDKGSSVTVDFGESVPAEEGERTGVRVIPWDYWTREAHHVGGVSWARKQWELDEFQAFTERCKAGGTVIAQAKHGGRHKGKKKTEAKPRAVVCMLPSVIQMHLQQLFRAEQEVLKDLFHQVCASLPGQFTPPQDYWKGFIHRCIEVGPNRYREPREQGGQFMLDDQTKCLSQILRISQLAEQRRWVSGHNWKRLRGLFAERHRAAWEMRRAHGLREEECEYLGSKQPPGDDFPCPELHGFAFGLPRSYEDLVVRPLQDAYRRLMFTQAGDSGLKAKSSQTVFEGKHGLFRNNMMGKRVNQACRSVISPDNSVEDDQVFLPRRFAKMLTIPEVMPSAGRLAELRDAGPRFAQQAEGLARRRVFLERAVLNGPERYPGATRLELDGAVGDVGEPGHVERALDCVRREIMGERRPDWMPAWMKKWSNEQQQCIHIGEMTARGHLGGTEALSYLLWVESVLEKHARRGGPRIDVYWKVFRHLGTDDWGILNRQPTLHKSSWLGERVRIGRDCAGRMKTIRFHYANCKGFNADFDGDEMNLHIPQTERAQMELRTLTSSRHHFASSTSGKPLRGLIQDHVVSGVALTMPETFLGRREFDRLTYEAVAKFSGGRYRIPGRPEPAVRCRRRSPDGSSVWVELWTGKQVFSYMFRFITMNYGTVGRYARGITFFGRTAMPPIAFCRPGQLPPDPHLEQERVEVIQDYLVRGICDKSQLGAGGSVVECTHQVHGSEAAGALLSCFSRVLTEHLKHRGFSVGVRDLCLADEEDRARKLRRLDQAPEGHKFEADRMKHISAHTSELNKAYFPACFAKPMPFNSLAAMTMSGAKGSNVNATQMAVLLGVQTFDGQRVEGMSSGKTLPGTVLKDGRARCGGIGLGRFLSGIRPQQFVVHASSGRDGCIDTAVKTARSGYLQHSVIKGMEGLSVEWMQAAEGAAELAPAAVDEHGGLVQFRFGHDGVDPCRQSEVKRAGSATALSDAVAHHVRTAWADGGGGVLREWRSGADAWADAQQAQDRCTALRSTARGPPRSGVLRCSQSALTARERVLRCIAAQQGAGKDPRRHAEKFVAKFNGDETKTLRKLVAKYGPEPDTVPLQLTSGCPVFVPNGSPLRLVGPGPEGKQLVQVGAQVGYAAAAHVALDPPREASAHEQHQEQQLLARAERVGQRKRKRGSEAGLAARLRRAQIAAHEPIGIIAAQSVGEPSTQMTLNTFHSVGQTVSHVTEGIPRLRQILQNAMDSEPAVMVPVRGLGEKSAHRKQVADAVLRMHTLLLPKTLSDVLCDGKPWEMSVAPSKGDVNYQQADVVIRLDYNKLRAYYAADLGVAAVAGGDGEDDGWQEPEAWGAGGGELPHTVLQSRAARIAQAMGLRCSAPQPADTTPPPSRSASAAGSPPPDAAQRGSRGSRVSSASGATTGSKGVSKDEELFPGPAGGAVIDLKSSLERFNAVLLNELKHSWYWDQANAGRSCVTAREASCEPIADRRAVQSRALPAYHAPEQVLPTCGATPPPCVVNTFFDIAGGAPASGPLKLGPKRVIYGTRDALAKDDVFTGEAPNAAGAAAPAAERPGLDPEQRKRTRTQVALTAEPLGICAEDRLGEKDGERCLRYHLRLSCPLHCRTSWAQLLAAALDRTALRKSDTANITGVFFQPKDDGDTGTLLVKGAKLKQVLAAAARFPDFPELEEYVRFSEITTTDHNDTCDTFGVEAGHAALLKELCRLFKPYGVDYRWLSLIADRCMQHGWWEGFSRHKVIANCPSLLHRMTFETALKVLEKATSQGLTDDLKSPSAKVMLGDWSTGSISTVVAPPARTAGHKRRKEPDDAGLGGANAAAAKRARKRAAKHT